jgi:hypothetical protein
MHADYLLMNYFLSAGEDVLFNRRTTAQIIGETRAWMDQRAIRGGGIPYTRKGCRCFYMKRDILKWLEEFRHKKVGNNDNW